MSNESKPSIIYNVAGSPLKSFFTSDMQRLGAMIQSAGFEGVSALPFRTEDLAGMYQHHFPPILLVEDAWNPGKYNDIGRAVLMGIKGALQRKLGSTAEPPLLQDTLFFPNKDKSEALVNNLMETNPAAHYGSVSFNSRFPADRTYVHIQSDYKPHGYSADEIIQKAEDAGNLLLFDPTHLLNSQTVSYPSEATRAPHGEWERQLQKFSSLIAGIDIHAVSREEMTQLLKGTGKLYELAQAGVQVCDQLRFLRVETVTPLISQVPLSPYQESGLRYLKNIVEVLKTVKE